MTAKPMLPVALLGALALFGACVGQNPVATPPDLSELRAVYQAPTGELTVETVEQAVDELMGTGQVVPRFDEYRFVPALLDELDEVNRGENSLSLARIELEGEGSGIIFTRCPVDGAGETEGVIETNFTANAGGLNAELWGVAKGCSLDVPVADDDSSVRVRVDGDFSVWLIDQQGFSANKDQWTFEFEGSITVNEVPRINGRVDLEWDNGTITTRIPLPDGSWFFASYTSGATQIVFSDTQGALTCSLIELACKSDDGHPLHGISI